MAHPQPKTDDDPVGVVDPRRLPIWLTRSSAIAEQHLRSIPQSSLGPAGTILITVRMWPHHDRPAQVAVEVKDGPADGKPLTGLPRNKKVKAAPDPLPLMGVVTSERKK